MIAIVAARHSTLVTIASMSPIAAVPYCCGLASGVCLLVSDADANCHTLVIAVFSRDHRVPTVQAKAINYHNRPSA